MGGKIAQIGSLVWAFLCDLFNPMRIKEENEKLSELTQGIVRDPFGQAARRGRENVEG